MAEAYTRLDLWLGRFESDAQLAAYMEERYSATEEQTPISAFAAGQDQWFYDHDFVEHCFFEQTDELHHALRACSFASSYLGAVVAAYEKRSLGPVNCAVLVFGGEIRAPRSVRSRGYELVYLGRFEAQPGV